MKRIFTIVFVLCMQTAVGQWNLLTQVDSTMFYNSVHCVNDSTVFIAGLWVDNPSYSSVILRSVDEGNTWDTTYIAGFGFRSIHFPTPDTGYAVGEPKLIAKTTDGGDTWNVLNTDSIPNGGQILRSVYFTSTDTGYICTADQGWYFGKTVDGGVTWTDLVGGGREIYFPNSQTGYVIVSGGGYKTTDAGSNWSIYDNIPNIPSAGFTCVYFVDDNIGFIGGGQGGKVSKTTDGGQNWDTKGIPWQTQVSSLHFVSDSVGYLAGVPYVEEMFLKTIDQGENWYPQQTVGQLMGINDVYCANDTVCYGVTSLGLIYKTTNGGGPLIGLGMEEREEKKEITLYPNPITNQFTVSGISSSAKISLFDLTGRKLLAQTIKQGEPVNVGDLPKGLYLWQVGKARGKIIIQ